MGILLPAALALIALAIPIVIFYMLRLRREELSVSSSMLWRRVLQDRTANAPWQRLRRNLLLLCSCCYCYCWYWAWPAPSSSLTLL